MDRLFLDCVTKSRRQSWKCKKTDICRFLCTCQFLFASRTQCAPRQMLMRVWAGIHRGKLDVYGVSAGCLYNVHICAESLRLPSPGQRVPSGRETPRGEANSDPENNHPSKTPHRDPSVQEPGGRQLRPCRPQPRPPKGPDPRERGEESHSHQEEVDESAMSWRDIHTLAPIEATYNHIGPVALN